MNKIYSAEFCTFCRNFFSVTSAIFVVDYFATGPRGRMTLP